MRTEDDLAAVDVRPSPSPRRQARAAPATAPPPPYVRDPDPSTPDLPGCRPVPLRRRDLDTWDGRFEYWDGDTETAWVMDPASLPHEWPSQRLTGFCTLIAAARGSPIECFGSTGLELRDERGRRQKILQADQCVYVYPRRARLPRGGGIVVGADDPRARGGPVPGVAGESGVSRLAGACNPRGAERARTDGLDACEAGAHGPGVGRAEFPCAPRRRPRGLILPRDGAPGEAFIETPGFRRPEIPAAHMLLPSSGTWIEAQRAPWTARGVRAPCAAGWPSSAPEGARARKGKRELNRAEGIPRAGRCRPRRAPSRSTLRRR